MSRPYQTEAVDSIMKLPRCLVKMFCGTGKSYIMVSVIKKSKKK